MLNLRRIKTGINRIFPTGKIEDQPLDRIKCIRHTITWRCNYKCTSCDIWKIEKPRYSGNPSRVKDEASVVDIYNMCQSELLKDVTEIIISGGEPLLRDDFVSLIMTYHMHLPKARFGITINGYDPDRAYRMFDQIDRESRGRVKWQVISVSLNGERDVHNKSRGLDCYDKVIETAKRLRRFGTVSFSFTFLCDNINHFDFVNSLGKSLGITTHVCWTVMNERFKVSNKDLVFKDNPDLVPVLERYADVRKIKYRGRIDKDFIRYKPNIKAAYLYDSILNRRVMPCHAARTFFHLGPYGDVYPCNFELSDKRILGNIKDDSIDDILSRVDQSLISEIESGKCMYPGGSLCGDSDINRSISQVDTPVFEWYKQKRINEQRLIQIEDTGT